MLLAAVILLTLFSTFINGVVSMLPPSSTTTPMIIEDDGYPVEEHTVITADGYILTMHRIPYSSKTGDNGVQRPVAFLMHGMISSSSDWVLSGPDKALGYILSDNGFDVWLGNTRGNTYSRNHITKSPKNALFSEFWNFEWHQIAIYDLPAMINYIIHRTGVSQIRYIGHSQGTTTFLVLNSLDNSFKTRIRSAHLLAPIAFMENSKSPIMRLAAPIFGQPNALIELIGSAVFLPSSRALEILGSIACRDTAPTQEVCTNLLFLMFGFDSPFLNRTMIPEILSSTPAGCSSNQVVHYLQLHNSAHFRQFDFGFIRNLLEYGRWSPPDYDLASIDVPIFLYYSDNDLLAAVADVERLIQELSPSTIRGVYRMPQTKWNHIDFLWGINATQFLYNFILEDMRNS